MREIKFRAWDKEHKVLRDVTRIDLLKGTVSLCEDTGYFNYTCNMDEVILMQCTGLKYDDGVEIYEGDIFHLGDKDIKYVVIWDADGFSGKQVKSSSYAGLSHWRDKMKQMGNIYENPELLEG